MDPDPANLETRVSEFRGELREFHQATTASLTALRADFVDLRSHVGQGFTEMRGKLDGAAAGQQHIIELIQGITDRGE